MSNVWYKNIDRLSVKDVNAGSNSLLDPILIAKKQHAFFKQTPVYDNKLVPYTNVEFGKEKRFL